MLLSRAFLAEGLRNAEERMMRAKRNELWASKCYSMLTGLLVATIPERRLSPHFGQDLFRKSLKMECLQDKSYIIYIELSS